MFWVVSPLVTRLGRADLVPTDNPVWPILYLTNWLPDGYPASFTLAHLWSLAVEEQFYLLWPAVVYLLSRRRLTWVCLGLLVAAPIIRCVFLLAGANLFTAYKFTFCRVDALGMGALIALATRDDEMNARLRRYLGPVACVSLLGLVAITAFTRTLLWKSPWMTTVGLSFTALLGGCAVWISLTLASHNRLLTSDRLKSVAKYSYGIYVLHPVIAMFLTGRLHSLFSGSFWGGLMTMLTLSAISLLAAMLSWWALESRAQRFKTLFPYPRIVRAS